MTFTIKVMYHHMISKYVQLVCSAQFKWSKFVIGKKMAGILAFDYNIVCARHLMTLNDLGKKGHIVEILKTYPDTL